MIARYLTECAICDGSIAPGTEIVRDADGDWVHAHLDECDATLAAQAAGHVTVAICRVCRCQMPCWCDDGGQPEDAADQALRRAVDNAGRDPFDGFL